MYLLLSGTSGSRQNMHCPLHYSEFVRLAALYKHFSAPTTESEKAEQDMLFKTILKEAVTFHFWNGLTSAMVPETESLAYRVINYNCSEELQNH
uniref:Uncharacterized protein At4g19900-like n=1 Tax=Nicotiana sylvestris TaxID=4096 RepID=A0A1U7XDG0_NICSY|nr:PREDICTED: uncharacterized protein At4g19900-like [Nicotiana sylvestris]